MTYNDVLTWVVDVCEVDTGDSQQSAQVDHPPRIGLLLSDGAPDSVEYVRLAITIHRIAGVITCPDTALVGRQVSRHAAYFVRFR